MPGVVPVESGEVYLDGGWERVGGDGWDGLGKGGELGKGSLGAWHLKFVLWFFLDCSYLSALGGLDCVNV